MRAALIALIAAAALAGPGEARANPDEPYTDGVKALIDQDARQALADGDLDRAWDLYSWLVRLDPDDARALRELGRVAAAKGSFVQAEKALARCLALRGDAPDPEARFIRGEALLAIGRRDEALSEFDRALAELHFVRSEQRAEIWRARIYTLRGEPKRAVGVLEAVLPENPARPGYAEVAVLLAEVYILTDQQDRAIPILRELLRYGDNDRAEEMLAWALERGRDYDRELYWRRRLAEGGTSKVAFARALERARHPSAALDQLREAESDGDLEVAEDIDRLDGKLSPELMGFGNFADYPTGSVAGAGAAASVPLGKRFGLVAIGRHDRLLDSELQVSSASVWGSLGLSSGDEIAAGGTAWRDSSGAHRGGGEAMFRSDPGRWLTAYARAEVNAPWLESAIAVREAGSASGVELHLLTQLFTPELTLVTSGQSRRLKLGAVRGEDGASADVHHGTAGIDWVVWADHSARARGQSLRPDMLLPSEFASSLVLSARHSEVLTRGDLAPRLFLVDRSRIEQLSLRGRLVLDDEGILSLGANAGAGYDSLRETRLWHVGGELLLSLTPMVRLSARSQLATETTSGLTGERLTGFLGINADL